MNVSNNAHALFFAHGGICGMASERKTTRKLGQINSLLKLILITFLGPIHHVWPQMLNIQPEAAQMCTILCDHSYKMEIIN